MRRTISFALVLFGSQGVVGAASAAPPPPPEAASSDDAPPAVDPLGETWAAPAPAAPVPAAEPEGPSDDELGEYKRKYLWWQDWASVDVSTGRVVSRWSVPKQGTAGYDLKGVQFYEALGRDDLATRYRKRNRLRWGLGLGSAAVGTGVMFWGLSVYVSAESSAFDTEVSAEEQRKETVGMSMMVGGAVVAGAGALFIGLFRSHPVSANEARRLADDYNRELRKRLGIPESMASLRLRAGLARGGGQLSLSGRF